MCILSAGSRELTGDYSVVTNGYILLAEGTTEGQLPVTILADSVPELDEKFMMMLTRVDVTEFPIPWWATECYTMEGGHMVQLMKTVINSNATIQILENDNLISAGKGSVYVYNLQGESEKTIQLEALSDNIPEVNEEYQLHLVNMRTTGVGTSGAASLDPILRTASVTIQGSNNPHGVLQFSSNSLNVRVSEASNTVRIQLDRKFGAIGAIRVEYEITNGSVSLPTSELVYATPNTDFVAEKKFIDFANGVSSAAINVTIMDDETPEVDEVFVVRLLSVVLINQQSSGEPPVLGSSGIVSQGSSGIVSQVIVNANDGTKGVVIFKQDSATTRTSAWCL
ncbi:hypothetical protein DPMN_060704 [Dreissena polymorpha]|uniref:Calx-beta domain-containing protein n=1 Tax=Dreissena polymorpha TaxID=45954 RepID=A0A9D4C5R0_DREPO|nr:hypothetical protein DPMN_060704 [Dreissena polymorpha]